MFALHEPLLIFTNQSQHRDVLVINFKVQIFYFISSRSVKRKQTRYRYEGNTFNVRLSEDE